MDAIIASGKNKAYSEDDMRKLCEGKVAVMTYREAVAKGSIDAALGPHKAMIVLIETEPNYGHWCGSSARAYNFARAGWRSLMQELTNQANECASGAALPRVRMCDLSGQV